MTGPLLEAVLMALPLAIVLALSPMHLVPSLLILTGSGASSSRAFVLAWAAGVALVVALAVGLGEYFEFQGLATGDVGLVLKALLGMMLILGAVRHWRRRGRGHGPPAWWDSLAQASPRRAGLAGLGLSLLNPKVILLAGAAGAAVAAGEAGAPVGFVAVFTAVASTTIAVPLVARSLGGARVASCLARLRDVARTHHAPAMAGVMAILGGVLVVESVIAW